MSEINRYKDMVILRIKIFDEPVSIAARSKASTVFGRSNIGIVDSNPARGMDMCPRFSVLC